MTEHVVTLLEQVDRRAEWCPISQALDVVGNRSAFLLMREAYYGTTRFEDLVSRSGFSEAVVAARLKDLVDEGLMERRPYQEPGMRTRHEYHLTESGGDFFPVLAAMASWSSRWRGPSPIRFQHRDCGARVRVGLQCEHGHDIDADDIELVRTK